MSENAGRFYLAEIVVGVVVRVIVAPTADFPKKAGLGGTWVDVTRVTPRPSPEWTYDGSRFTPPREA